MIRTLLVSHPELLGLAGGAVGVFVSVVGPMMFRAIPTGRLAGTVGRGWSFIRSNPKSSIAGVAAGLAAFVPKYATQIMGVATCLGFLMTSDAEMASSNNNDKHA